VVASRQLVLRAGGRLHGDVETPCFELEKHAFFNGRSRMERPEVGLRSRSERERPAGRTANTSTPSPSLQLDGPRL
jgi:cytoskeletal protein CcmA (bactofilin family)